MKISFVLASISVTLISITTLACTWDQSAEIGKAKVREMLRAEGVKQVRWGGYGGSLNNGTITVTGEFTYDSHRPGFATEHVGSYTVVNCSVQRSGIGSLGDPEAL